ncbi:MAG: hypothetical protein IPM53_10900 [Anaerolineaceae bacterium]|nr:hypothetical protein [Anaerolineaceae bacterium]
MLRPASDETFVYPGNFWQLHKIALPVIRAGDPMFFFCLWLIGFRLGQCWRGLRRLFRQLWVQLWNDPFISWLQLACQRKKGATVRTLLLTLIAFLLYLNGEQNVEELVRAVVTNLLANFIYEMVK